MNEAIIERDPRKNKWKQFKYQNIVSLNNNTLHTFGSVYSKLEEYLTNLVNRFSDLDLKEVEHPNRDISYQKIYDSNKVMVDRTILPRAVMLFNLDVNMESDYKIPTQHRFTWLDSSRVMELFDIKYSHDDVDVDWLRDTTINMVGSIQESLATVFYTVLTNSQAAHIELVRKMKMIFPDEGWMPIYHHEFRDKKTNRVIEVPYTVEYSIPRDIIEKLKIILKINSDEHLARFLKKYSYNKITYKVSGEEQSYEFYVDLMSIIKIKCNSIEDGVYSQENRVTTYACKLEFTVRYIDFSVYKLSILGYILNILNKDNYYKEYEGEDGTSFATPIYVRELPNDIKGTTEFNTYEFQYIDEDFKTFYIDEETGEFTSPKFPRAKEVKYGVLPMCNISDNGMVNEYIEYITDEYGSDPLELENYVNIFLTSKKVRENESIISNKNMLNIENSFLTKEIIDKESRSGDSVYISIYLNMKHFNEWKIEMGYNSVENLSAK